MSGSDNMLHGVLADMSWEQRRKLLAEQGRILPEEPAPGPPPVRTSLRAAGVPPRYLAAADIDLGAWGDWRGHPWAITFLGPVGSGKTWAATRLLAELMFSTPEHPDLAAEEGQGGPGEEGAGQPPPQATPVREVGPYGTPPALWVSARQALADLKREFDGRTDGRSLLERMTRVTWLLLDDLGAERATPWAQDTLGYVLCYRYDHLKPTILTSNTTLEEASELDPRVVSRLSAGRLIRATNTDRRPTS